MKRISVCLPVIFLLLAACSPGAEIVPQSIDIPVTAEPMATDVPPAPAQTEEAGPVETPVVQEWPARIMPERPFTRSAVTAAEQATFELLASANYDANDPVALAIAISGAQQPEPPPAEPPTLVEGMTEKFWIHNTDTLEWTRIEAKLRKISEHGYLRLPGTC